MALREPVEKELAKLESQGILTRLEYSDWATPIVLLRKSDGSIRICGDYKSTVNQQMKSHVYKVPSINDLLPRVDGGKDFAKLDMTSILAVDGGRGDEKGARNNDEHGKFCSKPFTV